MGILNGMIYFNWSCRIVTHPALGPRESTETHSNAGNTGRDVEAEGEATGCLYSRSTQCFIRSTGRLKLTDEQMFCRGTDFGSKKEQNDGMTYQDHDHITDQVF